METFPRYWPLWGESTGHWWILLTKANYAEFWSTPEQRVEQAIETPVIWARSKHNHYVQIIGSLMGETHFYWIRLAIPAPTLENG